MVKLLRHIFKFRGLRESFSYAFKGIEYLFLYHRNMRLIFLCGFAAFLLGLYFHLKGIELIVLFITVTMVFMAEIFNTAIELMIDMVNNKYHTLIKVVKDISAAVVLIASFNALAIGYLLFVRKLFK